MGPGTGVWVHLAFAPSCASTSQGRRPSREARFAAEGRGWHRFNFSGKRDDRLKLYWVSDRIAIDGLGGSWAWRRDAPILGYRLAPVQGVIHRRD